MKTIGTAEKIKDLVARVCLEAELTFDDKGVNFRKIRGKNGYHIYFRSVGKGGSDFLQEIRDSRKDHTSYPSNKNIRLIKLLKKHGASETQIIGGCANFGCSINVFI